MATFYARSNMVDFSDTTGWSATSGGGATGTKPGSSDDVIFDSKSGSDRSIFGTTLYTRSITFLPGAPYITTNSSLYLYGVAGFPSVIRGSWKKLDLRGGTSSSLISLSAQDATFVGVQLFSAGWSFQTDITSTGEFQMNTIGQTNTCQLNGHTLTCTAFSLSGDSTSYFSMFYGGGGTVNVTGYDGDGTGSYSTIVTLFTGGAMQMGTTGTFKLSGPGGKTINEYTNDGFSAYVFGNFVNACPPGSLLVWQRASSHTFTSYDAGKGTTNQLPTGFTFQADNWILDGSGLYTTIQGTGSGGAATNLFKTGGVGTIAANYCNFQNVNGVTPIRAINSKSTGSNSGITFLQVISRFLSFL